MNYLEAEKNCIFKYVSGSNAYGTNTEESDEDIRGVFINPLKELFYIYTSEENIGGNQTVRSSDTDSELHELRKFLKLASDCNPNIIEFLYVDRLILHTSDAWEKIKENRQLFLSKKAKFTFSGYAIAQLKRIKSHRRYLLNPPTKKPERSDYGLTNDSKIPKELFGPIMTFKQDWLSDRIVSVVEKEKEYLRDMSDFQAYQLWRKNRNPKRQKIEDSIGFDSKHAMHLVRLINMCKEILTSNTLSVFRPERDVLMDIRNGKWTFDQIEQYAIDSEGEFDKLYMESSLRDSPDRKSIQKLYYEICKEVYQISF